MKLAPSIGRGNSPFHGGAGGVSRLHPRLSPLARARSLHQPPTQPLAGRNGAFSFHHIQPTPALRREMEPPPPRQLSGFLRQEGLIRQSRRIDVQAVQHDPDDLRFGKRLVHQPLHLPGNIFVRPLLRHVDGPPSAQRSEKRKQGADAVALVCIIHSLALVWFHRQGLPNFLQQWIWPCVCADHRALRIVGRGGALAPIFHLPERLRRALSEASLPLLPGRAFGFTRGTPLCRRWMLPLPVPPVGQPEGASSSSSSPSATRCRPALRATLLVCRPVSAGRRGGNTPVGMLPVSLKHTACRCCA